ncbi:Hemolysin activation/secretion protein [Sphingomonas sp. 8AM]|nr:Hemolysin activation/secretion protein [Sphingomonas sp. 8AM]
MQRNIVMKQLLVTGIVLSAGAPVTAFAQTASQITPSTLAPPVRQAQGRVELPQGGGPETPPGAEALEVTLGDLTVEGAAVDPTALAELRTALLGKRIHVSDIYAAARALEAHYAQAGQVLVRVTVPPQQLDDGTTLKLILTPGFIERIDATAVPARVRSRVAATLQKLVGDSTVTLAAIERALLLAGDLPGLRLRSTLAPGSQVGATVLVLDGTHRPVTMQLSLDNGLSESLGRYGAGLGYTFNSALGLGETLYLRASGYPNTTKNRSILDPSPRNRLLAAGVVLPLGNDGLTLTAEAVESRAAPRRLRSQPGFGSRFRRLSVRVRDPLLRSRATNIAVTAAFDAQREAVSIIAPVDFPLSLDELRVARGGVDAVTVLPWGGTVSTSVQASFGIDGLGARSARDASRLLPLSRVGSDAGFVKLDVSAGLEQPLGRHAEVGVQARAQTGFGDALANAEQFGIATAYDLSPLPVGTLQGDSGATMRGELRAPFTYVDANSFGRITPYVFGAWGTVHYVHPTVVERQRTGAYAYGLGARLNTGAVAGSPAVAASVEYGRAGVDGLRREANRFLFSVSTSF